MSILLEIKGSNDLKTINDLPYVGSKKVQQKVSKDEITLVQLGRVNVNDSWQQMFYHETDLIDEFKCKGWVDK